MLTDKRNYLKTYSKRNIPLELPDWNLLCLWRITADNLTMFCLFTFLCIKNQFTQHYSKKFGELLVNDIKIVNKIICYC